MPDYYSIVPDVEIGQLKSVWSGIQTTDTQPDKLTAVDWLLSPGL